MIAGPALLFCPADRSDRYAKAALAADTVILDLEDAVAFDAKGAARAALAASDLDPQKTVVRVNPRATGLLDADLAAVRQAGYRTVMIPKAETAADLDGLDGLEAIAICESPLGVTNAALLAGHHSVIALTWGAEDLVAALGGTSSRRPDGRYRDCAVFARSAVLLAAVSAEKVAFDTVHLQIADIRGLAAEAEDAAASGFAGSMCIHPSQVEVIRTAFRPSIESVDWARRVVAAAAESASGVFAYEGRMIDEPVLRQAQRILRVSP